MLWNFLETNIYKHKESCIIDLESGGHIVVQLSRQKSKLFIMN